MKYIKLSLFAMMLVICGNSFATSINLNVCVNIKPEELPTYLGTTFTATSGYVRKYTENGEAKEEDVLQVNCMRQASNPRTPWLINIVKSGLNCADHTQNFETSNSGSCLSFWSIFTINTTSPLSSVADKTIVRLRDSDDLMFLFNDSKYGTTSPDFTICDNTVCSTTIDKAFRYRNGQTLYLVNNK